MALAVATRTTIRRRHRIRFVVGSLRVALQARRSPGCLGGVLRVDRHAVFWTLTVWENGAAMNQFRESGVHGTLMPRMSQWAIHATTTAWKVDGWPSWDDAFDSMGREPRWLESEAPGRGRRGELNGPSSGWHLALQLRPKRIRSTLGDRPIA